MRPVSFWALHHWHSIRSIRQPFLVAEEPIQPVTEGGRRGGPGQEGDRERGAGCYCDRAAGGLAGRAALGAELRRGAQVGVAVGAVLWPSGCRTESQNFAPARTWLWQLPHATVARVQRRPGRGAAGGGAGRERTGGGACRRRSPGRRRRRSAAAAGQRPAAAASSGWRCPEPAPRNMRDAAAPPWAIPSPAPWSASAWAACRKPPASAAVRGVAGQLLQPGVVVVIEVDVEVAEPGDGEPVVGQLLRSRRAWRPPRCRGCARTGRGSARRPT